MFIKETEIYALMIALFIGAIIFLIIVRFALRLEGFKRHLKYINMEISRTSGSERKYWQKQKRRLFLSLIPFYK